MVTGTGADDGRDVTGRSMSWRRWVLAAGALVAAGCTSDNVSRVTGQLEVVQQLDFGPVALGRRKVDRLVLRNLGGAPLKVEAPQFDQPAPGDFTLGPATVQTLGPGQEVTLPLAFAPAATGKRAARLHVATDSTRTPDTPVEVWGEGVLAKADVGGTTLDFGKVAVRTTSALALSLTNTGTHTAEVTVNPPAGDDADFFSTLPAGAVLVPAGQTTLVEVRFAPMRLGPHVANLPVQPCPSCPVETIAMTGEGIASALVANPPALDFGYTEPAKSTIQGTTVTNLGTAPVHILAVHLGGDTAAEYVLQPLAVAAPFDLPQNQSFDAAVAFTPTNFDKKTGTVRVTYSETGANTQELVVPLGGTGGGPDLQVLPNPLSFPRSAVGMQVDKHVVIRNIGRDPTLPLVVANLAIQGSLEFKLVNPPPLPLTLGPGNAQQLTVRYLPLMDGRAQGQLVIGSNDAVQNPLLVPINGSASALGPCTYEVVPQQLDFGAVALGTHAQLAFAVRNLGTQTCAVANVRLAPGSSPEFGLTQMSTRMIDPGQTLLVPVEFAPDADPNATGAVDFDVSSPTAPHAEVLLTGRGVSPCLHVDPDHLDFGAVGLQCQPPQRAVAVRNDCGRSVAIGGCDVGTGASDAFAVDPAARGARTLAPGQDLLVPVTYAPKRAGDDVAPLFLTTDLSPAPLLVPLSGHAELRPMQQDTFVIPPQNKVDFLFVVDNSGSFTEEQDALSRNFDAFIRSAIANGVDYHIAVTTTGLTPYRGGWSDCPGGAQGGEAGRFFPTDGSRPRILTPQTPNVRAVFEENVKPGICHWWEEGLEASRLALSPPLVDHADDPATPDPNDGNLGFLRPEASLYVLYISDEDDSGSKDPNQFVEFLKSLKPGRPDLVSASCIVGLPSCPTAPSVGTRYMQVVNALGGMIADVCSPDWGGLLQKIGDDAFTPQSTFPLSRAPDGRDITVKVDGNEVAATASDGSQQWHYDPTIGLYGAVVFDPGHAPGPNTTVEVDYPVPCPPAH